MAETAKTYCRNCGALCAMEIGVEDGRLVSATPDHSVSPYGGYMCPKGLAALEHQQGGEARLFHSLRRDAAGAFETVANDRALDAIAAKIGALIAEHGPRAIAVYHGTGAYRSTLGALLEKAFLSAIGSPNLFSTMTIDQSAKWVTSGRMGVMASGKPNFADLDLAVIVGNNPVVTHQTYPFAAGASGAPARFYSEAKARGMKMIVIDPRRSETARFADLLIQPLPGFDAEIFAAIAHILLRDGSCNRAFCDRFVSQIDDLREATLPYTPEMAAARAGIAAEEIEAAARMIGEAKRAFIGSGTGPSMSAHSNLNDHMIEAVNALVGGYRRAGDAVPNPGTLNPRRYFEMAVPPTRSWEKGVKCHSADIGRLFGEFPSALLPDEIQTPGKNRIRAFINFGGNPVMALGDPDRAIPAFEDLELLVSLDSRENETTRMSDYVIASSHFFERHDITMAGDALFPEAFVHYAQPVVERPEGTLHDWEFFWGVAARLGLPLTLKYWTYGLDYDAIADGLELPIDTPPDPEEMIRFLTHKSRVPFETLKAHGEGARPDIEPQFVEPTPEGRDGKLEICPSDVAADLAALAQQAPPQDRPYLLTCRRIMEAMNSAYRDARRTKKRHPENFAFMNAGDMAREGLSDGDAIMIASEFGRVRGIARIDKGLRPGVVSMTHLFGAMLKSGEDAGEADMRGAFTGQLTSLSKHLEPINYMPRFSGVPVSVTRD